MRSMICFMVICLTGILGAIHAQAAVFNGLGDLTGGAFYSRAYGISGNGTTVVGMSKSGNGDEGFRWQNGVMQGLGDLPADTFSSSASGVNADGSIVAGRGQTPVGKTPAIWTEEKGWHNLPGAPGNVTGNAESISANGSTVAGWSTGSQAFRWKQGNYQPLGDLSGGNFGSKAYDVSDNGSVVVGYGTSDFGREAFRWQNNVMVGLGDFSGGAFGRCLWRIRRWFNRGWLGQLVKGQRGISLAKRLHGGPGRPGWRQL